jgi:hypothetical protein
MEPVKHAHYPHRQLHGPIAAPHVFQLMDDGALQVRFAPSGRVARQQDRGTPRTAGQRRGHSLVQQDFDGPANSLIRGEGLDHTAESRRGKGSAPQVSQPPQVAAERQQ